MRIAVIGAGITGLTTAFELAEDGHAVSVFERCESVSAAASFATTGLVSPGCVSPAAAPGLSKWLLRGLYSHRTALRWRPRLSRQQWSWLLRWWRANRRTHPNDVRAMVELARVSTERLAWLTEVHRIDYERSRGVLMLLRRNDELQPAHRHAEMLRELGVTVEQITPERCRELEPGLRHTSRLAGALHLVDDSVGNCREFTHRLRDLCQQRHTVQFHFNVEISGFEAEGTGYRLRCADGGRQHAEATPPPGQVFDAVVLCTGAEGSPLLKPLGLRLPLQPVYGYSVSFRCRPEGLPPRSAVVDTSSGVAIARLGERVRVSGGFELGDFGAQHTEAALAPLYDALHHWFPFAAQRAQPQIWKGARPMLPEGPPVIGPARQPGIWLNLGHGAHGWTLACGAARLLADQIAGRSTQLDPDAYSLRRWT